MVTSGSSRQSSRPFSSAGFASSASRNAVGVKACGISWAWIAIRLTAFSVASDPSRSFTLPEPRRGAGLRAARNMDADFWRGAICFLGPFGRGRQQLAVGIAADDVGHHGRGQGRGLVDFLAAFSDGAVDGEFAQNAFQLDPV